MPRNSIVFYSWSHFSINASPFSIFFTMSVKRKEVSDMPSPFPGIDPYIEHPEVWSDFHGDLAAEIRPELNKVIRSHYVARLAPRVTHELELPLRLFTVEVLEAGARELVTAIESSRR